MSTSYITAYTGMVAPPYVRTFFDRNTGAPLNLTGATFTAHLQNQATGAVTSMSGVWMVQFPVSAGVAQYQWTGADLSAIGTYSVFVSALLPADTGPREFDPDVLVIIPSAEYLAALIGAIVVGTDINIAGLGAGGSTPVITNLPADVIDRVGRLLGHVIVDTLPTLVLSAGAATIGGVQVVDSGGTNKAAISALGAVSSQDIEQAGYIAATAPPATTNVGTDTPYTFSAQVNRVIIANNTIANVNYAFDVAASAGSLVLVPGSMLVYPKKCTVLHLFTAAAQSINGTVAGNLIVLGAL